MNNALIYRKRKAFTLIEALSVVSIISILAGLAAFVYIQAQRQARDTRRKADLTTIAQGFETRFLDLTCIDQSWVGRYPGSGVDRNPSNSPWPWLTVSSLVGSGTDLCNDFQYYLTNLPKDPNPQKSYYYNISSKDGLVAKHYRLTASLEKSLSATDNSDRCRQGSIWANTFGGTNYDNCPNAGTNSVGDLTTIYNYIIGR